MSKVEDHIAIRELAARYNRAFDYGNPEAWVECFTEDGSFEMGSKQLAAGSTDLLTFAKKMIPSMKVKHCTTDAIVEVDGDTGTHDAYLDAVVKVDGQWKFKQRVVDIDDKS